MDDRLVMALPADVVSSVRNIEEGRDFSSINIVLLLMNHQLDPLKRLRLLQRKLVLLYSARDVLWLGRHIPTIVLNACYMN